MSNCILFLHSSYSILCYTRGSRDGKECDSIEVDQRSTYKPPLDLNNDKYSKSLIHVSERVTVLFPFVIYGV